MIGIRWLVGWTLAVVSAGICVFLAPAGNAAGIGLVPSPPVPDPPLSTSVPSSSPASGAPALPTLVVEPTAGSAGTQVEAIGEEYTDCQTSADSTEPPGDGQGDSLLPGEVSLFWDGVDHLVTVDIEEDFGFSADFTVPESASPGEHEVVSRCTDTDETNDEVGAGSATFTVTSPPVTTTPELTEVPVPGPASVPGPVPGAIVPDRPVPAADPVPAQSDVTVTVEPPPVVTVESSQVVAPPELSGAGIAGRVVEDPFVPGSVLLPWWILMALLFLLATGPGMVLLVQLAHKVSWRGPGWVGTHVRAVAGAGAGAAGIEVGPRTDQASPPTFVVRIAPHTDNGTQVLEVEK